jgi:glycosyltransferase involved in cell wall biosynthesis
LFTEHGRHYPDFRRSRRVLANQMLLRPGDRITAVGRFVGEALVAHEGIPRRRVEVIYNGIDPQTFAPLPDGGLGRRNARATMGVPEHVPVLLQVARFHPVKDHTTAIRAFARAHDQFPDARLVLVGDGDTLPEMQQIAWNAGVADHVHFLGVRDDVHALLPGADLFVLSSLSEGVSVTLLEAMAARLPIVATHVGGNPEIVEHGQTGLLSPRRDEQGMSHNMMLLLGDPATRRRMGDAGHDRLLARFTQEQMHSAYARLYDQMTARR